MSQTTGQLHWSVDYSYQTTERDFRREFSSTLAHALASAPTGVDADKRTHRYAILPNFESGWKREAPEDDPTLRVGGVSVERTRSAEGGWAVPSRAHERRQRRSAHPRRLSGETVEVALADRHPERC